MKILLLFLAMSTLSAKQFTVNYTDCHSITYIDTNNDATFDSLIVDDCGKVTKLKLDPTMTVGNPELTDYTNSTFEIRLKNYNYVKNDSYFQVRVWNNGNLIGYFEHIMGSHKLIWKTQN